MYYVIFVVLLDCMHSKQNEHNSAKCSDLNFGSSIHNRLIMALLLKFVTLSSNSFRVACTILYLLLWHSVLFVNDWNIYVQVLIKYALFIFVLTRLIN